MGEYKIPIFKYVAKMTLVQQHTAGMQQVQN